MRLQLLFILWLPHRLKLSGKWNQVWLQQRNVTLHETKGNCQKNKTYLASVSSISVLITYGWMLEDAKEASLTMQVSLNERMYL